MGVILLLFTCANACQEILSGARSVLPMGVAPEAIVKKMCFDYRLKSSFLHHHTSTRHNLLIISSGACSALPMVVAPETIIKMFSGTVSLIDCCLVGANLIPSLMSSFIRKSPYSILCRVHASVSLILHLLRDVSCQF
jgi:hypothetical protein